MKIVHKFKRIIPDKNHLPPDHIWDLVGMVYHQTWTKKYMTAYEVQAELMKYYSDYIYDGFDVAEVSLIFVTACLYLCCEYGLMEMMEEQ